MKSIKKYLKISSKAQIVLELAVFGAILIFVLGMIIKSSMAISYRQNQVLKAMRMAMRISFIHSAGLSGYGQAYGNSSRNSASILIVEDRLSVSMDNKYGSIERTPYINTASATYSRNLFMPLDYDAQDELPRMDLYINGKHFIFTLANFKEYSLPYSENFCSTTTPCFLPPAGVGPRNWYFPCIKKQDGQTRYYGCYRMYKIVFNGLSGWEYHLPTVTPPSRFDLDRDGTDDVPIVSSWDGNFRQNFAWQWAPVYAVDMRKIKDNSGVLSLEPQTYNYLKGYGVDIDKGKNVRVDVDGDLQEETIIKLYDFDSEDQDHDGYNPDINQGNYFITGIGLIKNVKVIDSQEGDVDFSKTKKNADGESIKPGFDFNELSMATYIFKAGENPTDTANPGTYYRISEGKLYNGEQYYRRVRKKDQVDIIQRVFQLSNNTGRFCSNDAIPTRQTMVDHETNPVEVCCNGNVGCSPSGTSCFDQTTSLNLAKTCMDTSTLRIYIRSRVKDQRGEKWITKTQNDNYINFQMP